MDLYVRKIDFANISSMPSLNDYIIQSVVDLEEKLLKSILSQYLCREALDEDGKRCTCITGPDNDGSYYHLAIDGMVTGIVRRIWDGPKFTMTFDPIYANENGIVNFNTKTYSI
jgi:hypothetical protein